MDTFRLALPKFPLNFFPSPTTMPPNPFAANALESTNTIYQAIYEFPLKPQVVLLVIFTYFSSMSYFNKKIRNLQILNAQKLGLDFDVNDDYQVRRLPAVPCNFTKTQWFKNLVLFHNLFLCIFSSWAFLGIVSTLHSQSQSSPTLGFWPAVCNTQKGIFDPSLKSKSLAYYGYFFYLSKFYEIFDTTIIVVKGRPSLFLQTFHHSGAMLSMWSGMRYTSPPIWIFVAFNSLVHAFMYGYYTLCTLHIKVPKPIKQSLTTIQITQFIVGGSLAMVHLFIEWFDTTENVFKACITNNNQLMALYINVGFLFPLTALFMQFFNDSYVRRAKAISEKQNLKQ